MSCPGQQHQCTTCLCTQWPPHRALSHTLPASSSINASQVRKQPARDTPLQCHWTHQTEPCTDSSPPAAIRAGSAAHAHADATRQHTTDMLYPNSPSLPASDTAAVPLPLLLHSLHPALQPSPATKLPAETSCNAAGASAHAQLLQLAEASHWVHINTQTINYLAPRSLRPQLLSPSWQGGHRAP